MNNRERFKAIMNFKSVDRYLNSEIGVWEQTIDRWESEGLPKGAIKNMILYFEDDYFGLDVHRDLTIDVRRPFPFINKKIISEDDKHEIFIDKLGIKRKGLKSKYTRGMSMSMDQILENPVRDRDSWHKWKKNFTGNSLERYPPNWEEKVMEWNNRDYILFAPGLGQLGFYSFLRNLFGTEGVSYILYDDPKLVEEILNFLTIYYINVLEKALSDVKIDWFMYFEDMAYKNGPLISPEMVKKYIVPRYKKINEFLRSKGVDIIFIDSDGDINDLIPLYIESGINGISPIEVNAGMDVVKLRKEYGKDLCMMGGINKVLLTNDKKAIEEEVRHKIVPIIDKGGYIPTIDHLVPPDVSFENFKYYLDLKGKALSGEL